MERTTKEGIRLSDRELFCLGMLLRGQRLIGIPEPFPGWLTEEIEELLPEIRKGLQARGIVREAADGSVTIEAALEPALRAVVLCAVAVIATLSTPQMTVAEQRMFYFKRPQLAELRGPETEGERRFYTLHTLDGHPTTLLEQLVTWWSVLEQPAPECPPAALGEAGLAEACKIAAEKGAAAAAAHLAINGVNGETAAALAETLATAKKNGALVITGRGAAGWRTENCGLLEGENGLWRLHSLEQGSQRLVECVPCEASTFRIELQKLLAHFIYPGE